MPMLDTLVAELHLNNIEPFVTDVVCLKTVSKNANLWFKNSLYLLDLFPYVTYK
jgi:hypothetical protein